MPHDTVLRAFWFPECGYIYKIVSLEVIRFEFPQPIFNGTTNQNTLHNSCITVSYQKTTLKVSQWVPTGISTGCNYQFIISSRTLLYLLTLKSVSSLIASVISVPSFLLAENPSSLSSSSSDDDDDVSTSDCERTDSPSLVVSCAEACDHLSSPAALQGQVVR